MSRGAAFWFGSAVASLVVAACLVLIVDASLAWTVGGVVVSVVLFAIGLYVRRPADDAASGAVIAQGGSRAANAGAGALINQGDNNHFGDTVQAPVPYVDPVDVKPRERISNVPPEPR